MSNLQQYASTQFGMASDIEEATGFEPLPAGDYILKAIDAEVKDTKDGQGKYLNVKFQVAQENGSHTNRSFFQKFNFQNVSQQAQQIGMGQLKALCRVARGELQPTEVFGMQHVIESLNQPFIASVKIKKDSWQGQEYINNEISSFKSRYNPLESGSPEQMAMPQQSGGFQQQAGFQQQGNLQQQQQSGKPAWQK